MVEEAASPTLQAQASLDALKRAASGCTACPLHLTGTQTVFGDGPIDADIMLVGEQPGDAEDKIGLPFVGPAGKLLDRALAEAGLDRRRLYVTNAVKHFKWEPRGKRRIHNKPNMGEIRACHPWLEAEIALIKPDVIVCLGATAAQALLGPSFRVSRDRGRLVPSNLAARVMATIHPSALLRLADQNHMADEFAHFVADLRMALPQH